MKCEYLMPYEVSEGKRLIGIVASYMGVPAEEISTRNRRAQVAEARQIVCAVLHRAGWTLERIGGFLDRDHSSVHHAVTLIERRMGTDWTTRGAVEDIEREWKSVSGSQYSALGHIRRAVEEVHASVREGRVHLQELEREADALLNKIAQAEKAVA